MALATGEIETAAPFYVHNQRLIKDVQSLEDKARRSDVLVSEESLIAFYKSAIPTTISTRAAMELWCKNAENDSRARFSREMLMRHGAESVTEAQFPKVLKLGDFEVPLSYRFEPGHVMDGVTARLPLPLLNAVDDRYASWLVPGLWREKIAVLLKALPKAERGRVQPIPDTVTAFLELASPRERPLTEALLEFLRDFLGIKLPSNTFDRVEMPLHLQLNFRVMDGDGSEVAMGRDLLLLQKQLGQAARMAFQGAAGGAASDIEKTGLMGWTIGTLPGSIAVKRGGRNLSAYPACVDETTSVSVKLFESEEEADAAHRKGVIRLMSFELKQQLRQWEKGPSGFNQVALQLRTAPSSEKLLADFLDALTDRAFIGEDALPRDEKAFRELVQRAKQRIPVVADSLGRTLGLVAAAYASLQQALNVNGMRGKPVIATVSQWRDRLVGPHWLASTPWDQLTHLPRYIKALERRLHKFAEMPDREVRHGPTLVAYWQRWNELMSRAQPTAEQRNFRWLIEELNVSLFAQELKTPFPVSAKRLDKIWNEIAT
jgi:ATP-dependent helicase HrpA